MMREPEPDGSSSPPSPRQNTRSTDPQQKLKEYYEILRQMQMDNLTKMRDQLKNKPDIFLLNNLILSVQFFDNFER